ncbi:MAG: HAMP domain-containing protein [Deferribacteres bacterium]|nr:HAMP domain-containing protein [candidate division KSB1 bacterium]MCB9508644.1 HAMP domain-containing protein [Deferribacteres bacterium]
MFTSTPVHFPHRMFSRLLASHILLVIIPLLTTGYFLVRTAESNFKEFILERNREIALRSARQIELTLESVSEKLKLTANNPSIYGPNALYQQRIIHNLVKKFDIFREVTIFDLNGGIVQSTAFRRLGNGSSLPHFDTLRRQILTNGEYVTEVYLSDEQLPVMDIYEPVVNEFDEFISILHANVDLKEMWDLVDKSKIGGEGAEAFVFRSDGQYIAHTNREKVIQRGQHFREKESLPRIAEKLAFSDIYLNQQGIENVAAYSPIRARSINWGIVIQQPTSEAFAVVDKMEFQVQLLLGASVAVASLIAFFYSRIILRPVTRLVHGIERIASGDLFYRIEPLGKDEISQLAVHINAMSTRLRTIQNKLKRAERLETLSKLASVLSHEIRNPLNSMVINMQILNREFHKPAVDVKKLDHYSHVVASEIKRVDDLVSNFLLIAKPPKLTLEEINLGDLIDEILATQQPLALPKGIRIERRYESNHVHARIDSGKIKQVFLNMIINAIHAMPGGGRLVIEMRSPLTRDAEETSNMIEIVFRDTGKGIPPDELKHIFDFYFSTKPDGTGLGLSVAQQIVEEHGGSIKVQSEVEKGTEFFIYLPISAKSAKTKKV